MSFHAAAQHAIAKAPVLPGDTVGLFCARHGLPREVFFQANPHMATRVLVLEDGTPTAELEEGEELAVHSIFGDAYDYAKGKAGDAYDYAKDKAGDAYDYAKGKAGGAYDAVKDKVGLGSDSPAPPPVVSYDALSSHCSSHKGVKQVNKDDKSGIYMVICKDDQIFQVQPDGSAQDLGNASGFGDVGAQAVGKNASDSGKTDEGISTGAMVGIGLGVLTLTGLVVWGWTHRG